MGADLIISYVVVYKGTNLKQQKKNMLEAVKKLKTKDMKKFENYYETKCGGGIPNSIEDIKKDIIETINETFNAIIDGYRDVTWIKHKDDTIYISGGMSWGDTPTESCDRFNLFCNLPLKDLGCKGMM